jgi:hypothetical protein
VKLYSDDEINLLLKSAISQECKDTATLEATNRFLIILDGMKKDLAAYDKALDKAREVLTETRRKYYEKNPVPSKETWDEL